MTLTRNAAEPPDGPYRRMFMEAVTTLAAIDAELGLPEDGCNNPTQTLAAIKAQAKDAARYRWLRERSIHRSDPPAVHVFWGVYRAGVSQYDNAPSCNDLDAAIDAELER